MQLRFECFWESFSLSESEGEMDDGFVFNQAKTQSWVKVVAVLD